MILKNKTQNETSMNCFDLKKMFINDMSTEKFINSEVNKLPTLATPQKSGKASSSGRVDINVLLNRARKEKNKETLTNLVFAGLVLSLIFIVGIILSF